MTRLLPNSRRAAGKGNPMLHSRFVPLRASALCVGLLSPVLLVGCGGGSSSTPAVTTTTLPVTTNADGSITSTPRAASGLQLTLSANKASYAVGEVVGLTLAITNPTTQPITVAASSYANQNVRFQALQNNQVVWTSPHVGTAGTSSGGNTPGMSVTNIVSYSYTVPAGQTLPLSGVWFQTSDVTGKQAASGTYTIGAYLTTANINGVAFTQQQAQAALNANSLPITIHN